MKINKLIKKLILAVMAVGILSLSGCGKEKYVLNPVDGDNYNQSDHWFDPIMKNEYGYYYKSDILYSFHYYDEASGQSVFLCNRPECLHQGDEFCTATNVNYYVLACQMYDGKIYMGVQDISKEDSTDILLLRLDADGSNLTEIANLKNEITVGGGIRTGHIFIHRGVCFLSYGLMTDEKVINCCNIYNMIDGTQVDLEEYEFAYSKEGYNYDWGVPNDRFMGDGEYVYFNEYRPVDINGKIKSKSFLCRYNIETQVLETADINCIYKGIYSVAETNKSAYLDKFGNPFMYDWGSKESIKYTKPSVPLFFYDHEQDKYVVVEKEPHSDEYIEHPMDISEILYYDGKLIALSGLGFNNLYTYKEDHSSLYYAAEIDEEFNIIDFSIISGWSDEICEKEIEIFQRVYGDDYYRFVGDAYYASMKIFDGELYVITQNAVYKCAFDAFIKGEEIPRFLYEIER